MTSNYHPDQLYASGLQRERFLPAIELIKSRLDVVSVDSGVDYRRLKMEKVQIYHVGADAPQQLEKIFQELKDVEEEKQPLDVEGRTFPYRKRAGGLVWFDFEALCGGPRSYADYVDLTKRFHTIILSGVPRMSAKQSDAARRFTWLIDVLYDEHIKLVLSAAVPPEDLFTEGENAADFQRTVSRLHEMQSAEYRLLPVRRVSGAAALGGQQAQHRRPFENSIRPAGPGLIQVRGFLQNLRRRHDQLGACSHRIDLGAARHLELVHRIEGLLDGRAAREQAMVAQDHRVVRAEIAHQALALVEIGRRAFVLVIADMADEADRGLGQRQQAALHRRHRHAGRVCVWITQPTSLRARWMQPWIT